MPMASQPAARGRAPEAASALTLAGAGSTAEERP